MLLMQTSPLASPGGDTAWVLASAALVLLMTPGLAFFYGGMVRAKSVLNMMMMSFVTIGIVSILWVLYGFSVAFGDTGNGFWGGLARRRPRRARSARPGRQRRRLPDPGPGVLDVPADVRDHHPGADLRRHRRPREVPRLGHLRGLLGHARLLPGRPLGLRLRWHATCSSDGRAGSPDSASRTSPVAPRSTSTPVPRASPWRSCSASATAGPRRRSSRTTCRSCCSAPACCGSAGSASTPGSALAANQTAALAFTNTQVATAAGVLGWLHRGEAPRRPPDDASAPPPAPSPAWSRSPRPVRSSCRGRRSCSASSPVRSAPSPSG